MTKRPTIRDVADKAGVSIATVSFVLNNHPNEVISDKVKKRVCAAARQLNYHPSAAAAGLARKRTRNVSIVFYLDESPITNHFYSVAIQGAVKHAMARDYHLLFSYMDKPYRGPADLPKVIQERNAEGVLFMRQIHPRLVKDIQQRGLPVVAIDHFPAMRQVDSLQIDNHRGGCLAATHLIELGHTRIGMLQAATDRPSIAERTRGFRAELEQRGIRLTTRTGLLDCKYLDFEAAYEHALRAERRLRKLSALFCANDEMAAGVLRAAHELALRVPEALSVVGFDDIALSKFTSPPLTTVGLVKEELGRRAMARLLELVEGRNRKIRREVVPVELVVRRSTCSPAGAD
jgi:DNA-binding LacI/PurR family transcriptional regulator